MALSMGFIATGCAEKDLYDPDYGKQELPAPETFPDFSNWSAINLSVDYEMPGCKTLIKIYTDYPYETTENGTVTMTASLPQFAAYTDDNGRYSGKIDLPATTTTVYLCTSAMGLPACLALEVKNGRIDFKDSDFFAPEIQTRGVESPTKGSVPYKLDDEFKLYSLCQWGPKNSGNGNNRNYGMPRGKDYISDNNAVTRKWITALQHYLWGGSEKTSSLDNTSKLVDEKHTNITIANEFIENGVTTKVDGAEVKLTFLTESAWYQNALGYYFYPSNEVPKSPKDLKKYIIFPNVSVKGSVPFVGVGNGGRYEPGHAPLEGNSQITLKYFDKNNKASDEFPPGYTIGWFLISDGFDSEDGELETDDEEDYFYSNASWNEDGKKRCLVVKDSETGRVVVGFEDGGDSSCEDVLFYVESNPKGAILNPDQPEIGGGGEVEEPDGSYKVSRTLAFEDNWPMQGDYDMNDVVVTHEQVVTFNSKNMVTKIVDTFVPVQREDAATKSNAFAFQVDPSQKGMYASLPEGTVFEPETNSFVLFPDARMVIGKEIVLTRTFDGTAAFSKDDLKAYNPFVIIDYVAGNTKRAEVHLPKMKGTGYADPSLVGREADAYYIDKDGKHPFAIDIPTINFVLVTERKEIGTEKEYPRFNNWVEDGCKTDSQYADWYKKKQ